MKRLLASFPLLTLFATTAFIAPGSGLLAAGESVTIVERGVSTAPIVIPEAAAPRTLQAANELADMIQQMSGARPEVIEGRPGSMPARAIWVGYQPVVGELFSDIDFTFAYPEEILLAANGRHIVIAGRDIWDPENLDLGGVKNFQMEYGTANAVYTFMQDQLGVRWLWPGEWGTDIIETDTIKVAPFVHRYHPQVVSRGGLFAYSTLHRREMDWHRFMRLQLDSMGAASGGHGFGGWWERFSEEHPEYFALQPNGTRSYVSKPGTVKMCMSNMDVAKQWVDDVAAELEVHPYKKVFNASPNDGWFTGHCVCEHCLAWDHPQGEMRRFSWAGLTQEYVALSDRDVKFANRVARMLKERFPDKELYVYMLSYGHSRPAPIGVVPDDNVIIGNVANFLLRSDSVDRGSSEGRLHKDNFGDWGKLVDQQFWRPNVGSPVGFQMGLPDVPVRRTIDDLKFAADNGMMGIYVDYVREFWATQGPLYYIMAQLIWDPQADAEALLKDYYKRAFGPAAAEMEAYWDYLEAIREEYYETSPAGVSPADWFTRERLAKAQEYIQKAYAAAQGAPEKYRQRIRFVEVGLDYTILVCEAGQLMKQIRQDRPSAAEREKLTAQVIANWEEIRKLQHESPDAMRWRNLFGGSRGTGAPALRGYYPN